MRASSALLLGAIFGASCGSAPEGPASDALPLPPDEAWVAQVVLHPERFSALIESTSREGWIAYHSHRYGEAWDRFGGDAPAARRARGRAAWSMARTQEDLARLYGETWTRLTATWTARGTFPASGGAPTISALAARCADPAIDGPGLLAAWGDTGVAPWEAVALLHHGAVGGEVDGLLRAASTPLAAEQGDGFVRTFYDPCVHRALALGWEARADEALAPDGLRAWTAQDIGLEGLIFAPWLSTSELTKALDQHVPDDQIGGTVATLAAPTSMTPQQLAREEVRQLDSELLRWRADLKERAPAGGEELLTQLTLAERYRVEHLTAAARAAIATSKPRRALALLELARDVSEPGISPLNSPSLLALTATAQLQLGHTREALDTLQPLREAYPETLGLTEVLGDLVVLESMNRQGDSKEN
ncbi:MAG: hypothetical protein JXX28_12745 [Deltaproteobacteria bacterium]|nr:hypothetical protein [Deltaproteobacteria bacterium]